MSRTLFTLVILGGGGLTRRRVLPAAVDSELVSKIVVGSRYARSWRSAYPDAEWVGDYREALEVGRAGARRACWISLVNTEHFQYAKEALAHGYHVIVDKPAVLSTAEAETLCELAEAKGLVLAESNIWRHHTQFGMALEEVAEVASVQASFTLPPLPKDNFRMNPDLGGGALWDLGPYAASLVLEFLGSGWDSLDVQSTELEGGVDTAFSIQGSNGSTSLQGAFGFGRAYSNTLLVVPRSGSSVLFERAFTTPRNATTIYRTWTSGKWQRHECLGCDTFESFLNVVLEAALCASSSQMRRQLAEQLLARTQVLARIRALAQSKPQAND